MAFIESVLLVVTLMSSASYADFSAGIIASISRFYYISRRVNGLLILAACAICRRAIAGAFRRKSCPVMRAKIEPREMRFLPLSMPGRVSYHAWLIGRHLAAILGAPY